MNSPRTIEVSVDQLCFDPDNPRLPTDVGTNQSEIFRYLVEEIGVEDLLSSMSSSGFISADPIIVIEPKDRTISPCDFVVIEGNRRLAAIKLLSGHSIGDGQPEPTVVFKSPGFPKIPVETGWDENALEAYLGYKHVTASREWGPEAKARFVVRVTEGDLGEANLKKFAAQFGTQVSILKKWLNALLILQQAENAEVFDPKNVATTRYFGTFYTLLSSSAVQQFLGFSSEGEVRPNPIPQEKISALGEFLVWSIGTKEQPNVINSRSQKKLDTVLRSPKALDFFRRKLDIDQALLYTEFNAGEIAGQLRSASFTIEQTFVKLYEVREHEGVQQSYAELTKAYAEAGRILEGGKTK